MFWGSTPPDTRYGLRSEKTGTLNPRSKQENDVEILLGIERTKLTREPRDEERVYEQVERDPVPCITLQCYSVVPCVAPCVIFCGTPWYPVVPCDTL